MVFRDCSCAEFLRLPALNISMIRMPENLWAVSDLFFGFKYSSPHSPLQFYSANSFGESSSKSQKPKLNEFPPSSYPYTPS